MRDARLSLALAIATLLACAPIALLSADPAWLPNAALLITLLAGSSVLLRLLKAPYWLAQLGQLAVFLGWLAFLGLTWPPTSDAGIGMIERLRTLVVSGAEHIRTSTAPMPAHAGTLWLLLAFLGLVFITAELLTIALEQPAWSITALATPYLLPALALGTPVPWWYAGLLLAGYCLVLATESANAAVAPQNVSADTGGGPATSGRFRLAALIAVPVAAGALLIANSVPAGQFERLVTGRGSQTLELGDPSIELADNLRRPNNQTVLTYRTNAQNGVYLRLTALPILDANGAKLGDVQVRSGALPSPAMPGTTTDITTQVTIDGFSSEYLPVPYAPTRFDAAGEWGWEPLSLSVLSLGDNRKAATRGLSYTVDSVVPNPDSAQLAAATAGRPVSGDERTTVVPDDVPVSIVALTKQVTSGRATAGQRALAIQDFLRDTSRFTYSTQAPEGAGYEVLERFLLQDHSGYCVHFATAMALMARIEGIPSRVAIGFLPGKRGVDDRWSVSARDMHAWPELYFAELGWVSFEPTAAVASQPEWTAPQPTTPPPTVAPEPTAEATADPTPTPTSPQAPDDAPTPASPSAPPSTWPAVLGWLLVVVGALLAPWAIRTFLRRRRLAAHPPADVRIANAWAEARATWIDRGGVWPDGSPRRVATTVGAELDPGPAGLFTRLALLMERSLYAKQVDDPGDLAGLVTELRRGMERDDKPYRRLARLLLPRSLWPDSWLRARLSRRSP